MDRVKDRQEEIYAVVDQQIQAFVDEMTAWAKNELEYRQGTIKQYIEQEVKATAPALQDEDTAELVMANASDAMEKAVQRLMDKYLDTHIRHLAEIERKIEQFPIPDDIAQMSDQELTDALVAELGSYSMNVFQGSLSPETRDFLREVGEEKE